MAQPHRPRLHEPRHAQGSAGGRVRRLRVRGGLAAGITRRNGEINPSPFTRPHLPRVPEINLSPFTGAVHQFQVIVEGKGNRRRNAASGIEGHERRAGPGRSGGIPAAGITVGAVERRVLQLQATRSTCRTVSKSASPTSRRSEIASSTSA